MNTMRTIATFLIISYSFQSYAEEKELSDIKEIRREMQEGMEIANAVWGEAIGMVHDLGQSLQGFHTIPQPKNSSLMKNSIDYKTQNDSEKIEILIDVPHVENSEAIKAYANLHRLKFIVPQKGMITKIIVDQNKITKKTQQRSEQKNNNKKMHSYRFSSSQSIESKSLPFPVDITERKVEYKDDILFITLNKSKESLVQKAQPRIIPVINK